MTHWLDRQARHVAQAEVTRRSLLSRSAGVASGAMLGRYVDGAPVPAAAATVHPRVRKVGPCSLKSDPKMSTLSRSVTVRFGKQHLKLEANQTHHQGNAGSTTLSTAITLGHATVLEVLLRKGARGSAADGTVHFGRGFSGVRTMTFTTTDGKTISGEIDGRSYYGYRLGTNPSKIRFRDGKVPPRSRLDPALARAMRALLEHAHKQSRLCHDAAKHRPRHSEDIAAARSDAMSVAMGGGTLVTDVHDQFGSDGGRQDASTDGACVLCVTGCDVASEACQIAGALGCDASGPFYPICVAAVLAGCFIAQGICLALCYAGGAPCCPVTCGSACCSENSTCLDPHAGLCCFEGETPCNGGQCCNSGDVCLNNGHCCPPDKVSTESICCPNSADKPPVSCKGVCCDTGEVCNDGVCCPSTSPVCDGVCCNGGACLPNGKCCMSPSHVCGDVCCGPFNTCCADVCCSGGGDVCISGTCCPQSLACGNTCCSSNEVCTDPATGTCGPTPCPQGQTICQNFTKTLSTCCANGLECCNGNLCCDNSAGLFCCGTLGCVPTYVCVQ